MNLTLITLSNVADFVTICGLPLTFFALVYAIASFRSAERAAREADTAAREAAATSVLQSYLQLRAHHPEVGRYIDEREDDELNDEDKNYRYGWIGLHALFTAEQIYIWKGDDPSWLETAALIVGDNEKFVKYWGKVKYPQDPFFRWKYYTPKFQTFVRGIVYGELTGEGFEPSPIE